MISHVSISAQNAFQSPVTPRASVFRVTVQGSFCQCQLELILFLNYLPFSLPLCPKVKNRTNLDRQCSEFFFLVFTCCLGSPAPLLNNSRHWTKFRILKQPLGVTRQLLSREEHRATAATSLRPPPTASAAWLSTLPIHPHQAPVPCTDGASAPCGGAHCWDPLLIKRSRSLSHDLPLGHVLLGTALRHL